MTAAKQGRKPKMAIPASAYANLHLVPPPAAKPAKPIASARQQAALRERDRELRLKEKIDQANGILDLLEARGIAQGIELKAIQKRKAATLERIERIEDRILQEMANANLEKACGIRYTFTKRENAASLLVDHDELVPKEFRRIVPASDAPDKVAMKAFLVRRIDEDDAAFEARTAALSAAVHLEQSVTLLRK
jgi:hypothetical protein